MATYMTRPVNPLNRRPASFQQRPPPPLPPKDEAPPPAPLPRQNSKTVPPSPPRVIRDVAKSLTFTRIGFLGEGGFARVYEVADLSGKRYAIKVVTKSSLKTKKSKTKLYAEIKLHRSLHHPNIVAFEDCFEDTENVYMTLELCTNGSMMDMLRHRRRFTETESRFYLMQVIGACQFMHTHNVIHRDLKLGNLFLDNNMNIKVGDFGLAALIETPGERKKTICGTPNYIAPEVLFDTANGHSFEVDTWSIGVILYTLVVGKPPFQTKDVKAIYQRIRDNNYEFPQDREFSEEVQHLVSQILTHNPLERPTLFEIIDHPFFIQGLVPLSIPKSALEHSPAFPGLTLAQSRTNLVKLRRLCLLDDDEESLNDLSKSMASLGVAPRSLIQQTAAQQERDFQKAVQPASPISALLSSARQPLVVATGPALNLTGASPHRDRAAMRKGNAPPIPALGINSGNLPATGRSPGKNGTLATLVEQDEDEVAAALAKSERNKTRELESQKARIVAQMAPDGVEAAAAQPLIDDLAVPHPVSNRNRWDSENVPPAVVEKDRRRKEVGVIGSGAPSGGSGRVQSPMDIAAPAAQRPAPSKTSSMASDPSQPTSSRTPLIVGFEEVGRTLTEAFAAKDAGRLYRPLEDIEPQPENIFIVSWVDYCNKYGMGYALTDGTIGVHFNDSTTLLMSPDKKHLDYISLRKGGSVYLRKHYLVADSEDMPSDLSSKVYLLKHFENYMMERLYGDHSFCFNDVERTKNMDFVEKYFRMKNVIVFKLSHDMIQFNFNDHTKLILSAKGLSVSYLDKHYRLTHYSLSTIMEHALNPSSDDVQRKADERLLNKLKYCKEVLTSIRTAATGSSN